MTEPGCPGRRISPPVCLRADPVPRPAPLGPGPPLLNLPADRDLREPSPAPPHAAHREPRQAVGRREGFRRH